MTEYAPKTLQDLYARIKLGSKALAGIVGDARHGSGYHRGRAHIPASDYSRVLRADATLDGEVCCALDVRLSATDMDLASTRLMAACRHADPRTATLREWFGTVDGQRVTGWDRHDPAVAGDDGLTTSDSSHLWHIHLSIYRSMITDPRVYDLADVINGVPLPAGPRLRRQWPSYMPPGHYFGLAAGPEQSHGGYYATEQADVTAIQQRLVALGYRLSVDGQYGPATAALVRLWQRKTMPGTTRFGEVWADDWRKLFTY